MSIEHFLFFIWERAAGLCLILAGGLGVRLLLRRLTGIRRARLTYPQIPLANEGAIAGLLSGLANVFGGSGEEWIQLTPPLGDYPHERGMQRIDAKAVTAMANHFKSLGAKLERRFGGVPFYVGHPDVPGIANEYPDKRAYGWITEVEARADGLYGKAKWSEPGKELLANAHYKFFSPFWNGQELGKEQGKKVFRPVELVSVGLTNKPNLPVNPLANEEESTTKSTESTKDFMERLAILTALGLANEATDEQVRTRLAACVAAYTSLANVQVERDTAKTALSNEQAAHSGTKSSLEVQLANARTELALHRKGRAELLVDAAIKEGKVPIADRAKWIGELDTDFVNKSTALANTSPVGPQTGNGRTAGMGDRREGLANVQDRKSQLAMLMNEKQSKGLSYDDAWQAVQRERPELFDAMTKPGK